MHANVRTITIALVIVAILLVSGLFFFLAKQNRQSTQQRTISSEGITERDVENSVPPQLTKVNGPTQIKGSDLWIFVQDDGETAPAVSSERDGQIVIGRLNLQNPTTSVTWKTVASSADTGGERIADHWHIFAHDAHWLVFSLTSAKTSYLMKLSKNFERQALVRVGDPSLKGPGGGDMPTNDMFMVDEDNGVAVGHFLPGYGTRIFRFDTNATLQEVIDVGGGQYSHANLSSAEKISSGYLIYASETGAPNMESSIRLIETDKNWHPLKVNILVQGNGKNIVMPSVVRLANDYRVMHARVRSALTQSSNSVPTGGPLPPDDGSIVRFIIAPNGKVVNQQTIIESGGNRPHTTLIDDQLITSWDQSGIYMQIDRVSTK